MLLFSFSYYSHLGQQLSGLMANLTTAPFHGTQIFSFFCTRAASTNMMKCRLKLQKDPCSHDKSGRIQRRQDLSFQRRWQDADSGTGQWQICIPEIRCNACFKDTFIFAVLTMVVWSCLWSVMLYCTGKYQGNKYLSFCIEVFPFETSSCCHLFHLALNQSQTTAELPGGFMHSQTKRLL